MREQLGHYMSLRNKLKDIASLEKPDALERVNKDYRDLRERISVTKDQIPIILKDIFELFVDSHSKKSLFTSKRLIDDIQKRQIRQAVLLCCAFCGPDSEFEANKLTSRFLDLARITNDDEYEKEGLTICIRWYTSILEGKTVKKD